MSKYTATITLSVQIEFNDTDSDSAHNHAWDVAEQLSSYLGCARGDYPTEPEIDDVTIKEEENDYERRKDNIINHFKRF